MIERFDPLSAAPSRMRAMRACAYACHACRACYRFKNEIASFVTASLPIMTTKFAAPM